MEKLPVSISQLVRACRSIALMVFIGVIPAVISAVQPADGFFYGIEMDPVGDAPVTIVESEPAVALVFAADQKTAEITRLFNQWYNSPSRPDVSVFAIAVEPGDISRQVLVEAINQRDLQMPVFIARSDMLLGDDFRLLVLNDDQEVQRFTTLDAAGVNKALAGLGITIPEPPPPAPVDPVGAAIPPVVIEPSYTPPDDGSDYSVTTTTVTTTTVKAPPTEMGGANGDPFYVNYKYGMAIQFPPGWRYQVAAQQDGAVAFEPSGSKMDMRLWALPAELSNPQEYVDKTMEALAQKNGTRVNVERKVRVTQGGFSGLDITYNYTRLLDGSVPSRGALLYRGRLKVYLDNGTIKAARVAAPSREFLAMFPIINSFINSFENRPASVSPASGYVSPNSI